MEDISRDLEREIANAKPKLPKKSRTERILILSPDGNIRSGWYLRFCNRLLVVLTAIFLSACIMLYYMYNLIQAKNIKIIQELDHLGDTYQDLLHERESLMARLFLMEKNMGAASMEPSQKPDEQPAESAQPVKPSLPEMVTVQKFSIEKNLDDPDAKELIVKFDIRNVSKSTEDVSGRLFVIIKPRQGTDQDWLVTPKSAIKNGVPAVPEMGQPFSISRFRPVTFTLKTEKEIDFFHEAVVFVFDENGSLVTESVFGIEQTTINRK